MQIVEPPLISVPQFLCLYNTHPSRVALRIKRINAHEVLRMVPGAWHPYRRQLPSRLTVAGLLHSSQQGMVSKSHSAWSFSSILPPIQNTCLSSLPSEITGFLRVGEGLTFLFKLLAPALSGVQHGCSVSLTIGTPPDFPGTLALPSVVPSPVEGSGLGWLV